MGKRLRGIKAVAFDVYGTLVRIEDPRRPYRKLLSLLHELGRTPEPDDGARLMSADMDLAETSAFLGMALPARALVELEEDLAAELASVSLFDDALPTIDALRAAGFRIGVCSNLAFPYAAPVVRLLPQLDAYAWSFSVGSVKPDPAIYASLCDALDVSPAQVLMVGDTLTADYEGPRAHGMQACHLAREGPSAAGLWISRLTQLPDLLGL
jgi:HAD superfamily hydrolase (TIGR01549 family)